MPHKGNYGGKTPTKKGKTKAKGMHKMPSGMMMSDKEMKKMMSLRDMPMRKMKY